MVVQDEKSLKDNNKTFQQWEKKAINTESNNNNSNDDDKNKRGMCEKFQQLSAISKPK